LGKVFTPIVNHSDNTNHPITLDQFTAMVTVLDDQHDLEDGTKIFMYPMAFKNDVLHCREMLEADNHDKFVPAMQKKMSGLKDILEVILRSSILDDVPLPAIWAFKRKKSPNWTIQKYKARLNAHGGKQNHGLNCWETYALVVNWSNI